MEESSAKVLRQEVADFWRIARRLQRARRGIIRDYVRGDSGRSYRAWRVIMKSSIFTTGEI